MASMLHFCILSMKVQQYHFKMHVACVLIELSVSELLFQRGLLHPALIFQFCEDVTLISQLTWHPLKRGSSLWPVLTVNRLVWLTYTLMSSQCLLGKPFNPLNPFRSYAANKWYFFLFLLIGWTFSML